MKVLEQIISRATKIMGGDRRTAKIEELLQAAFEAGERNAARNIRMTLEDDHGTDHSEAIEIITANF